MVSGSLFLFMLSSSFGLGAYADQLINLDHVKTVRPAYGVPKDSRQSVKLLPIRERDLYPHLRKRDGDLSVLHLRDSLVLHYGGVIENQKTHLANVTVQKPDPDHPLILLEDIEKLTQSIKCADDKMTLEFKDKNSMDYAIKQWDWVNEKTPDFFYMITFHEHEGCGATDDRTSYRISAVAYDKSALTTTLTKEKASWDETAQIFQLQLSTLEAPVRSNPREIAKRETKIAKRGIVSLGLAAAACQIIPLSSLLINECEAYKNVGSISDAFKVAGTEALRELRTKIAEKIPAGSNTLDKSIPAPWTFNWGNESSSLTISHILGSYGSIEADNKVACVGCYVRSNPTLTMKATRVRDTADIHFAVKPNFKTRMDVAVQGYIEYGGDMNGMAESINAALEPLGVGEFINFMPDISNGPGAEMKLRGDVDLDFGFELDTGSGSIEFDIKDEVSVSTPGWNTMSLKPIGEIRKLSAAAEVAPYVRLGFGFGIEMLGGVFKRGVFTGLEVKSSVSLVAGLNPETSGCNGKVGVGLTQATTVNIIYKVIIDPITKIILDTVVGTLGFTVPELSGNIVEIANPKPDQRCASISQKQLTIPPRPEPESMVKRIKQEKINARKGTFLTIKDTKYRLEEFKCKDGQTHLLPFNQLTGGALFAWCDGREELDALEQELLCPFRSFGCNRLREADRIEEPANQYE
ncbi:hypothetical protein TWF718_004961 [Orbilia javanica]|uniref:DUF7029 domain-containing protein n=1 Tax=Orbilia javanica TaxID=47235 RepID=A0AAN8P089_9PEZI